MPVLPRDSRSRCSKLTHYLVAYLLIPGIFFYEVTIIYPKEGVENQLRHICMILFFFVNIFGNMFMSTVTDSSVKKTVYSKGTFCEHCQMLRPVRSYHCMTCNVCIEKRCHHCTLFARCIGLNNQRYFIFFLAHITISLVIAIYYNYFYFIRSKIEHGKIFMRFIRLINPVLFYAIPEPVGIVDLYVLYLFLNLAMIVWSGSLFFYHFRNVVMGVTSYESKFPSLMDSSKWRQNLLNVFGTRWYLAMMWPLCESPLPNGDKNT